MTACDACPNSSSFLNDSDCEGDNSDGHPFVSIDAPLAGHQSVESFFNSVSLARKEREKVNKSEAKDYELRVCLSPSIIMQCVQKTIHLSTSQRIVKRRLAESVAVQENIMKLKKIVKDKRRAKMRPKVNKSEAKVIKKEPKGNKREPKRSQKGAKWSQKGAKRETKRDKMSQKGAKGQPKCIKKSSFGKDRKNDGN